MNKKGFTLMELMGVLIILSLLMLLVFPRLINLIKSSNDTKDDITKNLIYLATENYIKERKNKYISINDRKYCITLKELVDNTDLTENLKLGDEDNIVDTKSIQVTYQNKFLYDIVDTEDCIDRYANGEVVYFDVDTGAKCSNYTETQSNTGVKSGCMKFYAFNDDGGDTLNLLLDHNTTAVVTWGTYSYEEKSDGTVALGVIPGEVFTQLKTDTASWKGTETPSNYTVDQRGQYVVGNVYGDVYYTIDYSDYKARLITANEVAQITGNTTWNETTATDVYYFDSKTPTASSTCTSGNTSGCKYGWLYDRTSTDCTDNGCLNNSDARTAGYWTASSTAYGFGDMWFVVFTGNVEYQSVDFSDYFGVRPVIEVSKSKLN